MTMRAALVLAALLAATPAAATEHYPHVQREPTPVAPDHDPCHLFETEDEFVSFYLDTGDEKVPLRAPKVYFEDRADFVQGATHGAQLFRVGIGDFLPVTRRETRGRMGFEMDWISFLLNPFVPVQQIARHRTQLYSGIRGKELDEFNMVQFDNGLMRLLFQNPKAYAEDLYIVRLGNEIVSLITCDRERRAPFPTFPNCNLWFEDGPILVNVLFAKWELPNWRRVRDRIERFITCMREASRQ